jgi:hypothetical protein
LFGALKLEFSLSSGGFEMLIFEAMWLNLVDFLDALFQDNRKAFSQLTYRRNFQIATIHASFDMNLSQ